MLLLLGTGVHWSLSYVRLIYFTHSHTHTLSHSDILTLTHTHMITHSHTLSHSLSHLHILTLTHSHTHTLSHSYTFTPPTKSFLDAFPKLRRATVSFIMSVRPSVCLHGTSRLPLDGFSLNSVSEYFKKSVQRIPFSLKSEKNNDYFTWRPMLICDCIWLNESYNDKCPSKVCRENKNTYFVFNNFFPKIVPFTRNCGKMR